MGGLQRKIACFIELGVHVPFETDGVQVGDKIMSIGDPCPCIDGGHFGMLYRTDAKIGFNPESQKQYQELYERACAYARSKKRRKKM